MFQINVYEYGCMLITLTRFTDTANVMEIVNGIPNNAVSFQLRGHTLSSLRVIHVPADFPLHS
jgi:hypothetical protein